MKTMEYFDPFPISTRKPSQMEIILARIKGKPKPQVITYNDQLELLRLIIENKGLGPTHNAYERALQRSIKYKTWQNKMPYLKDVPNIYGFRNLKKQRNDVKKVNKEILAMGGYLSKGQVLYRGGIFREKEIEITDGPISTTLLPSVARWHAVEVSGEIAILKISEENSIKGFAFKTTGNQKHKREYEILLQNNIYLKQTCEHDLGLRVVEYDVFSKFI